MLAIEQKETDYGATSLFNRNAGIIVSTLRPR